MYDCWHRFHRYFAMSFSSFIVRTLTLLGGLGGGVHQFTGLERVGHVFLALQAENHFFPSGQAMGKLVLTPGL